jgi:hypothetical protein
LAHLLFKLMPDVQVSGVGVHLPCRLAPATREAVEAPDPSTDPLGPGEPFQHLF